MRPATPQRRRELVPVSLRLSRSSVTPAKATASSAAKAAAKGSVLDSIASAAPPAIQAKLAATPSAKPPTTLPAAAAKQAALGAKDTSLPAFAFALSNESTSPPPITVGAMAVEPAHLPSFGFDLARKPQPAFTATPSKSQGTATNTWSQSVFALAAPKSGEWTCDMCELKNPDSATKCTVCDAAKPAPTTTTLSASSSWSQNVFASNAAKSGEWACDVCELKNPDSVAKCTVCDAARLAAVSAAPAPTAAPVKNSWSQSVLSSVSSKSGEWMCDVCELKNPDSASKCTVCDAARPAPKGTAPAPAPAPTAAPVPVKSSWSQSVLSSVSSKSGEWTCDMCELKNPDSAAKCTVCDAQRPGAQASTSTAAPAPASGWSASLLATAAPKNGEWTCGTCELKNPDFSSQCTVCDTPKPALSDNSASQPTIEQSAKHKASTLTPFELPSFAFDLDVSSKPLFPGAVRPSEWTCTVCELKNPDSAMQCTICDAPRHVQ
ncbi:hypothetical protein GGI23_001429 [Coemansia sp. RSA 2559]|nr:hypothetical protein GGI23_001429 [Coemansia sp. RSA 2559]